MEKVSIREKVVSTAVMLIYFLGGYMFINRLPHAGDSLFDVSAMADRALPFVAHFIYGYLLVYASIVICCIVIRDKVEWRRTIASFALATTVAYAFFVFMPVRMDLRPDLTSTQGLNEKITHLYYMIDLPYNCFPSLHVTYPTLAFLATWRRHAMMRWVLLAMALTVAISVLLVKQHYIADVVAGFINAVVCYAVVVAFGSKGIRSS